MKKKQPTLTHYTKRLKKVRLARTITVIATLFVSGVVVAANVLPQVIKSNASVTPNTTNDVINGGVDQYNGANAKAQLIAKVFHTNTNEAKSARALYAKFGVTEADIASSNTTYTWLIGPNASTSGLSGLPVSRTLADYGDWRSFGRNPGTGFTAFPVAYDSNPASLSPADFYHKPFKQMHPGTWDQGTSREPVLKGNGWIIALECGNIVVQQIPTNPTISFNKDVMSVKRGSKTFAQSEVKAAGFKLQINDEIKYRLRGVNGSAVYPAGLRLIDQIPTGTTLVTNGQGDAQDWNTKVTKVSGATVNGKAAVAWDFGDIAARDTGYTDFNVKVTSVVSQVCNVGLYGKPGNWPLSTNQVCLSVQAVAPKLIIEKSAPASVTSVKVGDRVTYTIKMTNDGNAAAPGAVALDILKRDGATNESTQKLATNGVGTPSLTKNDAAKTPIPVASSDWSKIENAQGQKDHASGNADAYGIYLKSMPAGSVLTFTVTAEITKIPTVVDGKYESCDFSIASMTGSTAPLTIESKSPQVCIPVIDNEKPHVVVTKTSPTANRKVSRGQTINYSIVIENKSTKAATTSDVVVTDTFTPGYFTGIKDTGHSTSAGATVTAATSITNGLTWKVTKLPASGKVTINISAAVVNDAADGSTVCNNATITTTPPNPVIQETSSTVCNTVSLIKQSKTASYVNRSDNPQTSPANAGDKIKYTLTTENQASTIATGYIVVEDLADVMNYADVDVASSGGATLSGTKLTWPAKDIPAGGKITNTFEVTVKDPVPNTQPSASNPTDFDYNMYNFYGNDVNIKVNKPLIQQIIDVTTNLPETGGASYALIVLFLGMSVYFFVRNKQLTSELAAATVEYQHQVSTASMNEAQNLIHPEEPDVINPEPPAAPPTI